jgi:hypothetical protein
MYRENPRIIFYGNNCYIEMSEMIFSLHTIEIKMSLYLAVFSSITVQIVQLCIPTWTIHL